MTLRPSPGLSGRASVTVAAESVEFRRPPSNLRGRQFERQTGGEGRQRFLGQPFGERAGF
ncbi:MAG TPA: hypothetical protein VIP46_07985 [Pyrinomonadaceae bacterium]